MTPSQVTAGLGLMKKVLPDMTENSLTVEGEVEHIHKVEREIVRPKAKDA